MIGDIAEKTSRNIPLLTGNRLAWRAYGLLVTDTDIDSRQATHARGESIDLSRSRNTGAKQHRLLYVDGCQSTSRFN